jgi:hypothetical protein
MGKEEILNLLRIEFKGLIIGIIGIFSLVHAAIDKYFHVAVAQIIT